MDWISVKDKLPCEYDEVLCCETHIDIMHMKIGNCWEGIWTNANSMPIFHVTHWMPLPKPPKKE